MLRRLLSRLSAFFLVATVIGCGGPAEPMDDAGGPPVDAWPGPVDTGPPGPACRFSIQCGPNEICVDDHCILAEAIPIEELEYLPEIRRATEEEIDSLPIAPLRNFADRDLGYAFPTFEANRMAMTFLTSGMIVIVDDRGVSTYPLGGESTTWAGRAPDGGYAYVNFERFVWVHGDGSTSEWSTAGIHVAASYGCQYGVVLEQEGSALCLTGSATPGDPLRLHRFNADGSITELDRVPGGVQLLVGPDGPEVVTVDTGVYSARPVSGVTPEPALATANLLPSSNALQDQPMSWVMPGAMGLDNDVLWMRDRGVVPVPNQFADCRPTFGSRLARFICLVERGKAIVEPDLEGLATEILDREGHEYLSNLCVSRGGRRTLECFGGWAEVPLSRRSR